MQRILKIANREQVALRTPAGDQVLISLIDDFDYEIAAQRRNKELMAFLDERFRQARKVKGIALAERARQLGLPLRNRQQNARNAGEPLFRTVGVSRRSQAVLSLLEQAQSEDLILKTAGGPEYALTAIRGDPKDASNRLSEAVMAHLDALGEQGKLPPLEVAFEAQLPRRVHVDAKRPRHNKKV